MRCPIPNCNGKINESEFPICVCKNCHTVFKIIKKEEEWVE